MIAKDFLKQVWNERKVKNPSYSLSAFARDLHVSQPHLSKILTGQRRLTTERAYQIGRYLQLNEKQLLEFLISTIEI